MKEPVSAYTMRHPVRHSTQDRKVEKQIYTVDGGQKLTLDQIWEHAKKTLPNLPKSTIARRLARGQREMRYLCEAPRKTCINTVRPHVLFKGRKS